MGTIFEGTPQLSLLELISLSEQNINEILARFDHQNSMTTQDVEIVKLYIDQIETAKNIKILLLHERTYKVYSMTRSLIEQFVYLVAIEKYEDLASRYTLFKAVDFGLAVYNMGKYKMDDSIV